MPDVGSIVFGPPRAGRALQPNPPKTDCASCAQRLRDMDSAYMTLGRLVEFFSERHPEWMKEYDRYRGVK